MRRPQLLPTISLGVCAILLALTAQSARLLQWLDTDHIQVQYSTGSPFTGRAFLQLRTGSEPMWSAVSWRWCPRLNPARWCIIANGDVVQLSGNITAGIGSISLSDAQLSATAMTLPLPQLLGTTTSVEAYIEQLKWRPNQPLFGLDSIDAKLILSDTNTLGFAFKPHRVVAQGSVSDNIRLQIAGEEADGTVTLMADNHYQVELSLSPNKTMAPLLSNKLPETAAGKFSFKHSGTLGETQ